jgi:ABC-2 type transport system ATP-binding protein
VIAAEGLHRRFASREVVRDVSFRVEPGEVVGFLGPNGAGKTTTLRLVLGLLRPDAGQGSIDGAVGYLPELHVGYDALRTQHYLDYLAVAKGIGRGDRAATVERALEATGMADLARRPVGRLSKGQRQRLGIAQALLGEPPNYVLDEPVNGLDPAQIAEARTLFRGLADGGAAVLLSTHLLAEAAATCDRVVIIADGAVVADEPVGPDLETRFLDVTRPPS